VLGGSDAMYQFELFRVELDENGDLEKANEVMKAITDYNKDDCLSTKLLYDWLRGLKFDSVQQLVEIRT
jgi:predicted RecB family nuclease